MSSSSTACSRHPLTIDGAGEVIVQLLDSGVVSDVPVPAGGGGRARYAARGPGTAGPRAAQGTARRAGREGATAEPPGEDGGDAKPHRTAPVPRGRRRRRRADDSARPEAAFGSGRASHCPLCGSHVVEQEKSFGCSGWKKGCRFAIWKTIAGKAIGIRTAQALLKQGKSPLLRGFRSKAGNRFKAHLKLEGGEVRFEFDGPDRAAAGALSDS